MAHGRVVCLQRPLRVIPRNACGPRSFAILLGSLEQRRAALEDPRRETMSFVTNALYGSLCKHLTGNKTNQKIERKKNKICGSSLAPVAHLTNRRGVSDVSKMDRDRWSDGAMEHFQMFRRKSPNKYKGQ